MGTKRIAELNGTGAAAKAAKAAAGGKAKKKVRIRSSRPKLRSLIPSRL